MTAVGAFAVGIPGKHQSAAAIQHISTPIGGFGFVLDYMSQCSLSDLVRDLSVFGSPVTISHPQRRKMPACNRYASDIRKAGLERDYYGFDEWSETRINTILEVFPKSVGPVIHLNDAGQLLWSRMRWGLPGPPQFGGAPVTNIRNVKSAHWRPLLGPAHRCLVPFTAFSEYEGASPKGAKVIRWFAPPDRSMLMFAAIWRIWTGDYGSKREPNVGEHKLFSFLTTDANDLVRPVHAKAMPVVLTTAEQQQEWLTAPADSVEGIQSRVLPSNALAVVPEEEAAQYAGGYLK